MPDIENPYRSEGSHLVKPRTHSNASWKLFKHPRIAIILIICSLALLTIVFHKGVSTSPTPVSFNVDLLRPNTTIRKATDMLLRGAQLAPTVKPQEPSHLTSIGARHERVREALKQLNITSTSALLTQKHVVHESPAINESPIINEEKEEIPELLIDIDSKELAKEEPEVPLPVEKETDDNDVVAAEEPHNVKAPAHVDAEAAMKEAEEQAEEVAKLVEQEEAEKEKESEEQSEKKEAGPEKEHLDKKEDQEPLVEKVEPVQDAEHAAALRDAPKPNLVKPVQRMKMPEISPDILAHNSLWLTADDSVSISSSKSVSYWADVSSGGRGSSGVQGFIPMSKDMLRQANSELQQAVHADHHQPLPSEPDYVSSLHTSDRGASVSFPCSLQALNDAYQLQTPLTAYFVLTPMYDSDKDIGQTFFGHYPSGQFELHDRQISFYANNKHYLLASQGSMANLYGHTVLLAYRFKKDQTVEMSINGETFAFAEGSEWTASDTKSTFSASRLMLGGSQLGHCGFAGEIFEVMLFDQALDDYSSKSIMDYLLTKHAIDAAPIDHVNAYIQQKDKTIVSPPVVKDGKVTLRKEPSKAIDVKDTVEEKVNVEKPPVARPVLEVPPEEEEKEPEEQQPKHEKVEQDVPISVKPKSQEQVIAQPKQEENVVPVSKGKTDATSNVCSGNEDPFKDQAIETFKPPRNAPLEEVMEWEDAVRDLKTRIAKMSIGGKTLRDLIWKEVRALQLKRFRTFCKYV